MTLKIKIEMDNAAFEQRSGDEVARILRKLAASYEGCNLVREAKKLLDVNGNDIGFVTIR